MTNEKTTDEKDPSGSYTLDMDDIESMGNLADLDIESFLSGEATEASPAEPSAPSNPGSPSSDDDPFAALENDEEPSTSAAEAPEVEDGATDRVIPKTKSFKAGSAEHAAKLQEQYARLAADYENFRKRSRRESEEAVKFANEQILRALLPIIDNLDRALESGGDPAATLSGVKMVSRQFAQDLRRFGLQSFQSEGEKFDPKLHEAFEMVETSDQEPGTVVRVFQRGYTMHDRLLRPAMVSVAKEAQVKAEESESDETPES